MVIGLTGGIGSGKSLVSDIIKRMGFPVFNSDTEAKKILYESSSVITHIKNLFGEHTYINDSPDRKKIAQIVFSDPEKLKQLNNIIHPEVRKRFESWQRMQNSPLIFREAAILIESGYYRDCDKIILVQAPKEIRIKRVMQRDNISESEVISRMKNQSEEKDLIPFCHYFIQNDGNHALIPQVVAILNELKKSC